MISKNPDKSIVSYHARCSCGWESEDYSQKSDAEKQAEIHTAKTGHQYVMIVSFPNLSADNNQEGIV